MILINAILVTVEMMGIFLSAFIVIFLLAYFLMPIETGLSKIVWNHSINSENTAQQKTSFKNFSRKHR